MGSGLSPDWGPSEPCGPYCSSEALCCDAVSSRPMSSWLALLQTSPAPATSTSAGWWPRSCPWAVASVGSQGSEKCFGREGRSKALSKQVWLLSTPYPTLTAVRAGLLAS